MLVVALNVVNDEKGWGGWSRSRRAPSSRWRNIVPPTPVEAQRHRNVYDATGPHEDAGANGRLAVGAAIPIGVVKADPSPAAAPIGISRNHGSQAETTGNRHVCGLIYVLSGVISSRSCQRTL